MEIQDILSKLEGLDDVKLSNGLEKHKLLNILQGFSLTLPESHVELLSKANGIMSYGGYFRIFGVDKSPCFDLMKWNSANLWRFAWNGQLEPFLCFGETAWGDQYAYKLEELPSGNPKVYLIEGITMTAKVTEESFEEFLVDEFLRNSLNPYDDLIVEARRKIGDLSSNEHLVFSPSILISGYENIEHVTKMDTVTAMVFNGDLCAQLAEEPIERQVKAIQPYVDIEGRNRLRVVWSK